MSFPVARELNAVGGLGICIPVLDEERSIGGLLARVEEVLAGVRHTIVLVDDGSRDRTVPTIEARARQGAPIELIRRAPSGPGCQRGGASRAGLSWLMSHTDHGVLVDLDADGSQRPAELVSGARHIATLGYDVAIASKYVYGSRVLGRPPLRRLASRVYSGILRTFLDPRIRDYSNSYRFYSRRAAQCVLDFDAHHTTPIYLAEMMARWVAAGMTIIEIPTVYDERDGGTSKVGWRDLAEGLANALRVGWRFRAGRYDRRHETAEDRTSGGREAGTDALPEE